MLTSECETSVTALSDDILKCDKKKYWLWLWSLLYV